MTKTRIILTLALTLLLGACANLPGTKGASSEDLIEAAGIDNLLASLSRPVPTSNVGTPELLLPNQVVDSTNQAIASVVKPDAIHAALKANIEQSMNEAEITQAMAFYQSPSGKAVVAAENGQPGRNIDGNDPRAIEQLDNTTGTSAIFVGLAQQTLTSTLNYANDHGCFGLDKNKFAGYLGALVEKALVNAVRDAIRDQMQRRYNTVPADALDAYAHFAQTPAGSKFFAARNQAISSNLQAVSAALSEALTMQVTQQCGQTSAAP